MICDVYNSIMKVESKRLNLLTHPLVGSLLHHKWKRFGQYGYFTNLLIYCLFLIFLTTFALIIENPMSTFCKFTAVRSFGNRLAEGSFLLPHCMVYVWYCS